jgi:hypothetical protein
VLDHLLEGRAAEAAALLRRIDVAESFPGSRAVAMLQTTVDAVTEMGAGAVSHAISF